MAKDTEKVKKRFNIRETITQGCPALFVCLAAATAVCMVLAAVQGVVYSTAGNLNIGLPFSIAAVFFCGAVFTAAALLLLRFVPKCTQMTFLLILSAAVIVPRVLYMLTAEARPVSDFMHMLDYGVSAAGGNFSDYFAQFAVFPTKFASGLMFAFLYKLTEPVMKLTGISFADISVIFNILCSLAFAFMLQRFAGKFLNAAATRLTVLIFAFWPAQIMYTNVPGASEHCFMLLYGGALITAVNAADRVRNIAKNRICTAAQFAAAGLLTAVASMIRPAGAILYMAVTIAVIVFGSTEIPGGTERTGKRRIAVYAAVLAVYLFVSVLAPVLIGAAVKPLTGHDISKSSAGFNVMMGTNQKSLGMFNLEDMAVIERNGYDFEKVHAEALQIGKDRITEDLSGFARLVWTKYRIMWSDEYYGYYWSMLESSPRSLAAGEAAYAFTAEHPRMFKLYSECFYISILLMTAFGAVGAFLMREGIKNGAWLRASLPMILFMGYMLAHCVLEVQSRYHYPAIAMLLPFAALGVQTIQSIRDRKKGERQ